MKHDEIKNKLEAFHDGELPKEESREIALHAESCAECRSALEDLGRLKTALSRAAKVEPSESFVARVMGSLPEEAKPLPKIITVRPRPFLRWALPLAGYAFALLLIVFVLMPREPVMNVENILLSYAPDGAQQFFSQESLNVGELLNIKEEALI